MKLLRKNLAEGFVLLDVNAENLNVVFEQVLDHLVGRGLVPKDKQKETLEGLGKRELQGSTAIGNSVAVPHIYLEGITKPVIVFVRLARPLNLGAPDGVTTRFLFILLGPAGYAAEHLDLMMNIARLTSSEEFRYEASVAATHADLLAAIDRFIRLTIPPPQKLPAKTPDELEYTGKLGGGLVRDIRRKLAVYPSDFTDGLQLKTISSVLFLFFACLAPAVTFGGFMALETENEIGAVEMIVASAICGIVFALFSGQPLTILGGTGPLLIFTVILYNLCQSLGIPFLPTYAWVGLWTALFLVILSVTEASCWMRFFTRFTDEIFAALISIIFISESIKAVFKVFVKGYAEESVSHDKALLTLILMLGTFYVALKLSDFRRSRYLRPGVREFLADFGPTIALMTMTAVALAMHGAVMLDPLKTPQTFGTTNGRPWAVNPFAAPIWVWFAAAIPALLGTILVYMDQNITTRLVNSPDHHLKKGSGYHLDMVIVGLLIGGCSFFGLPWLVAATVRSLNHVRSLATTEEVIDASGDSRERVIHVRETRLSALLIHVLLGLSLLLLPLLRWIPMAVLYGLFLYMGIVSTRGNQFFERMSLWLMQSALYPATHYIRKVPNWTIHKFTFIQLICLAVLWVVKESILGILFPVFIAILVPIRLWLNLFFKKEHLDALDAEEEPEEEEFAWH